MDNNLSHHIDIEDEKLINKINNSKSEDLNPIKIN